MPDFPVCASMLAPPVLVFQVCRTAAVKYKGFIAAFYLLTALSLNAVKLLLLRYASNCLEKAVRSNLSLSAGPPDAAELFPRSVEVGVLAAGLFKHGLRRRLFRGGQWRLAWPQFSTNSAASVKLMRAADEICG